MRLTNLCCLLWLSSRIDSDRHRAAERSTNRESQRSFTWPFFEISQTTQYLEIPQTADRSTPPGPRPRRARSTEAPKPTGLMPLTPLVNALDLPLPNEQLLERFGHLLRPGVLLPVQVPVAFVQGVQLQPQGPLPNPPGQRARGRRGANDGDP